MQLTRLLWTTVKVIAVKASQHSSYSKGNYTQAPLL